MDVCIKMGSGGEIFSVKEGLSRRLASQLMLKSTVVLVYNYMIILVARLAWVLEDHLWG